MKKAKLLLAIVSTCGVLGGALAFKTARQASVFYTLGRTTINGQETFACIIPVTLPRVPSPEGLMTLYSCSFNSTLATTMCSCLVIQNG